MTDDKDRKHIPEARSEAEKAKAGDKVLPGSPITTQADNALQQRAQQREGLSSYKLTHGDQKPFTIELAHGAEVKDTRPTKNDKNARHERVAHEKVAGVSTAHQADLVSATQRCIDEASVKWGHKNVQDIKIDKDDINAALTLSLLGPTVYKNIGHDKAASIGKMMLEHCAPAIHELLKHTNPAVPESIAHVKSNPADDRKFEDAGRVFLESCKQSFGGDQVKALHIDQKDWGAAIGLFMVGPSAYKAMGHDAAESLGKQTFLFGFAPAFGAAHEAEKAGEDLPSLGFEGSVNALVGYGAGFIAKYFPATAIPMALGGGALMAKEQFDPKTQAQNSQLFAINRSADQLSNSQLLAAGHETANIMGPGIFHGLFGTATGGIGFAHGEAAGAAAREVTGAGLAKDAALALEAPARHPSGDNTAGRVRIMSAPEKHASVEKLPLGFLYKIDGEKFTMAQVGHWAYGGVEGRNYYEGRYFHDPGIKLHVEVADTADLARLQKVLIPALDRDSELAHQIPLWKTDRSSFGLESADASSSRKAQEAKGFTLYLKDADRAKYLMNKIDLLLDKNGLGLKARLETGNVDEVIGKTNRVGLSRDKWESTCTAPIPGQRITDGPVFGVKLGTLLEDKIKTTVGTEKLSDDQLRSVERASGIRPDTILYDRQGHLMLRPMSDDSTGGYLAEGGLKNQSEGLTDRPAMYALSKHFEVDQLDAFFADRPPIIRLSLHPGEERALDKTVTSQVGGLADSQIKVGRDEKGVYIIDNKNPICTWELKDRNLHPKTNAPGTRVRAKPYQMVRLGNFNGPILDAYSDTNEVLLPRRLNEQLPHEHAVPVSPASVRVPAFETVSFDGKQISVNKSELIIGRKQGDLLLPGNTHTSGRHAAIRLDNDGSFRIRDLASTNGTLLNGVRLPVRPGESASAEAVLRPGDRLGLPGPPEEFIFTGLKDAPLHRLAPNETLLYRMRAGESNSVADPIAVGQSRALKESYEFSDRLKPGFQDIPNRTEISAQGLVQRGDPTTVFDPQRDQRLKHLFNVAHSQLDGLRSNGNELELRTALAKLAHDSLTPKVRWTASDIDAAYLRFSNQNKGQQVLLGEYLRQAEQNIGGGTCSQQVLLYKALCDDFALDTKIVRGHVSRVTNPMRPQAVNFEANHTWAETSVNGRELVFDPRAETHGVAKGELRHYFDGKSIVGADSERALSQARSKPDQKLVQEFASRAVVRFQGSDWLVEGTDASTGKILLSQVLDKSVTPEEFEQLNGKIVPVVVSDGVSAKYKVRRSGGEVESGWSFHGWQKGSADGAPGKYVFKRRNETLIPPDALKK